jgi:hypothetical protein
LVQTGNAVQSVAQRFEQAKGNVEFHTDAAKVNTREGCCKTVGLRLKSRGARWKQANVDRIAQLVCLVDSDGWGQW